ncbi:MAG TPA: hypothetical protein VE569_10420, partial [Acidimicrobiia bacterium]|nr:hypothetical protein [Acidimicrobiia bacterium]
MVSVDRRLVAVIGAGALVIAATLIIVFVAIVPIPDFAMLQPGQQSGYVAFTISDDGESPSPIHIVNLEDLTSVQADVGPDVEIAGWDEGNLVLRTFRSADGGVLIDPATGREVGTTDPVPFDGLNRARVYHDNETLVIEHPDGGTARFHAPESYDVGDAVAMGPGRIVFIDELGRVAVT